MAFNYTKERSGARKGFDIASEVTPWSGCTEQQTGRARICPTPHLNVDEYVRLLACIEREGGIATMDEISRSLPAVARPISAVFDLCDHGILCADLEAALDGSMRVWRLG